MSSIAQPAQPVTVRVTDSYRWLQLLVGIVCMAMIANLQYGWTLFVNPLDAKYHWGRASIQVAFTIFVLLETWLVPIEGYLVDRYGPRLVVFGRRHSLRHRVDNECLCRFAHVPVCRRCDRRCGRGGGLRHLRRQCAQVVS